MGNCWSKESPKTSKAQENEEPHSPLIRKETPPMNDASVSKIREGLDKGISSKKQKSQTPAPSMDEEKVRRERELQEAEARRKREEQLRAKEEKERLERELLEKQKLERERMERERLERERKERERFEKLERERLERLESERLERERQERERLESERLERERLERERQERERQQMEKLERERQEMEKLLQEQKEKEQQQQQQQQPQQQVVHSEERALNAFQSFPKEIFRLLFTYLGKEDRVKIRLLSKFFRDIMDKTGCLVFILNNITRHLKVPNMVVDDKSFELIGEDELRKYLSVNTWIRHILFRGASWSPSKAARVLQDNVSIVEDVAFRVSAHCPTEEFQQLEVIRKRNVLFNPFRITFESYPDDLTKACEVILQKHGPSIGTALLTYCVFIGNEDLVKFLLQKGIEPYFPAEDLKDSPLTLTLRSKNQKILQCLEDHFHGPLIGWFGKDIERPQVEALLKKQPPGTFLTRYSVRAGSYVISHVLPSGSTIEHMSQILPEANGKVKVTNNVDGTVFYDSFSEYIYKTMLKEGMYCTFPLPSAIPFSPVLTE